MPTTGQAILMTSKEDVPVVPVTHNHTKQLKKKNTNVKNNSTEKRKMIEQQLQTKDRSERRGGEKNTKRSLTMHDDAMVLNSLICQL
jgi:superfamily I DNA and/or RNA helicase